MELKWKFNKNSIIAALISGVCVCLTIFLLDLLKISNSWPAFMPFILFAVSGWKMDQLKSIFAGGVVGTLLGALVLQGIYFLVGKTGTYYTYLVPIFIAVFLLVALGDLFPALFNNYAFCFYTVAFAIEKQKTFEWILTMLLGGVFFVGSMLFLLKLFIKQGPEEKTQESDATETV